MSRTDRSRNERGTSTLEVAGVAPAVLIITMALLYAGFALYGITATQTAARQAARAASLDQDPVAAADRALPEWLEPQVSVIGVGENGIRVRTNLPDLLPGTDLIVSREAVMP